MKKKIYFTGPWFNPDQAEEHSRIYELINDNFDVFNPKLAAIVDTSMSSDKMVNVLLGNINAINESQLVVAITDRKDMGTIWETGYAYASKKPIIYYCETLGNNPFNLMLAKTGKVARNEQELLDLLNDDESWYFHNYQEHYKGEIE